MLMLGISIGVAFNVILADWMVPVLLIILFIGTSMKAFFKGVETWKRETMLKLEATRQWASNGATGQGLEYKPLPSVPNTEGKETKVLKQNMLKLGNFSYQIAPEQKWGRAANKLSSSS